MPFPVWSDHYDLTYQSFGRMRPRDRLVLRGRAAPDDFAAFFLDGGRVHAVAGLGPA